MRYRFHTARLTMIRRILFTALCLTPLALAQACANTNNNAPQSGGGLDQNKDLVADDLGGLVDGNGDGFGDQIDINHDGVMDGPGVDTDGDGTADALALDTDCDGFYDSIDTNGDGISDFVTGLMVPAKNVAGCKSGLGSTGAG